MITNVKGPRPGPRPFRKRDMWTWVRADGAAVIRRSANGFMVLRRVPWGEERTGMVTLPGFRGAFDAVAIRGKLRSARKVGRRIP